MSRALLERVRRAKARRDHPETILLRRCPECGALIGNPESFDRKPCGQHGPIPRTKPNDYVVTFSDRPATPKELGWL